MDQITGLGDGLLGQFHRIVFGAGDIAVAGGRTVESREQITQTVADLDHPAVGVGVVALIADEAHHQVGVGLAGVHEVPVLVAAIEGVAGIEDAGLEIVGLSRVVVGFGLAPAAQGHHVLEIDLTVDGLFAAVAFAFLVAFLVLLALTALTAAANRPVDAGLGGQAGQDQGQRRPDGCSDE